MGILVDDGMLVVMCYECVLIFSVVVYYVDEIDCFIVLFELWVDFMLLVVMWFV